MLYQAKDRLSLDLAKMRESLPFVRQVTTHKQSHSRHSSRNPCDTRSKKCDELVVQILETRAAHQRPKRVCGPFHREVLCFLESLFEDTKRYRRMSVYPTVQAMG